MSARAKHKQRKFTVLVHRHESWNIGFEGDSEKDLKDFLPLFSKFPSRILHRKQYSLTPTGRRSKATRKALNV